MPYRTLILGLFIAGLIAPVHAQTVDDEIDCNLEINRDREECDCDLEENRDEPFCLGLPPVGEDVTNFAPIGAGLAGVGILAGALGGGSGASGTTSTTSTTGN